MMCLVAHQVISYILYYTSYIIPRGRPRLFRVRFSEIFRYVSAGIAQAGGSVLAEKQSG